MTKEKTNLIKTLKDENLRAEMHKYTQNLINNNKQRSLTVPSTNNKNKNEINNDNNSKEIKTDNNNINKNIIDNSNNTENNINNNENDKVKKKKKVKKKLKLKKGEKVDKVDKVEKGKKYKLLTYKTINEIRNEKAEEENKIEDNRLYDKNNKDTNENIKTKEENKINPKTYNKNSSNNNFHFKEEDIFTKLIKNDFSLIKNIILKINQNLSHQSFDIDYSGTTLNLLIHINTHVISVNIGDSRSIILKRSFPKKTFEYLLLSIDHKPILKKEKERIQKSGGEVHKDIYEGKYEGPSRVWVKGENYPGIAISRSIGDYVAEKIGVISEPDIKSFFIDTAYKLAILASDGLWDAFNEEDIIYFSNQFFKKDNIENFSEEIGNESVKRWNDYSIERDDITVVTVLLNPF